MCKFMQKSEFLHVLLIKNSTQLMKKMFLLERIIWWLQDLKFMLLSDVRASSSA